MNCDAHRLSLHAWRLGRLLIAVLSVVLLPHLAQPDSAGVIEILADHDSRYKIGGQTSPTITVHAGEPLTIRITAIKAKNKNRNGSIHGFTLLRKKERSRVPGWDFELKPGLQEFALMAPAEAGEYVVVCTVICGPEHDGMNVKFVVLP